MARLLRSSQLPPPTRQSHSVGTGSTSPSRQRVGVECEGFEFHGHRLQWKRDKRRTAWIEAHGWRLLFVTWDDVTKRPTETLGRIHLALGRHVTALPIASRISTSSWSSGSVRTARLRPTMRSVRASARPHRSRKGSESG